MGVGVGDDRGNNSKLNVSVEIPLLTPCYDSQEITNWLTQHQQLFLNLYASKQNFDHEVSVT